MENETLEGLIASMEHEPRSFVDDDCVLRTSTINRHAATCKKCRAERILAGLRELEHEMRARASRQTVRGAYGKTLAQFADDLRMRLGQSATADQTSAGKGRT